MSANDLLERLTAVLGPILSDSQVYLAYLYGSAARGENTPLSDLDIAVLVEAELKPLERLDLEMRLELVLELAGFSQADVREVSQAPIIVKGRIITEGKILYCRNEGLRVEFETRSRSEYLDFLPFWEENHRIYLETTYSMREKRDGYDANHP